MAQKELTKVNKSNHFQQDLNGFIEVLSQFEAWLMKSGLEELEITHEGRHIRLKKPGVGGVMMAAAPAPAGAAVVPQAAEVGEAFKAPLVGTFYAANSPDAAPYVQVGTEVKVGQVLGIIEAMKTMNQITADRAGKVLKVLIQNGQPVEFGQPLFIIG